MRKLGEAHKVLGLLYLVFLFSMLLILGMVTTEASAKRARKKVKQLVVHLLLDATGSMQDNKAATMEAFNGYITSLKEGKDSKTIIFTLSMFNSVRGVEQMASQVQIKDVPLLNDQNYVCGASTPLYDAIGRTIHEAEKEDQGSVLIVIQTDGYENASQEYTKSGVKAMIEAKQKKNWQFVFLGSEIDAMHEAAEFGIAAGNTFRYDSASTRQMTASLSVATCHYAACGGERSDNFTGSSAGQGVDLTGATPIPTQSAPPVPQARKPQKAPSTGRTPKSSPGLALDSREW